MAEVYKLGGRLFAPAAEGEGSSFEQDAYLMGLVRVHGIDTVIASRGDVVAAVLRSGVTTQFIAGLLVDVGEEWTLERAEANAKHFGAIRAKDEKELLFECLRGLLVGFSNAGTVSSTDSLTASAATETTATVQPRPTKRGVASATGRRSARPSATITGSG